MARQPVGNAFSAIPIEHSRRLCSQMRKSLWAWTMQRLVDTTGLSTGGFQIAGSAVVNVTASVFTGNRGTDLSH
jgi:hypothetical protein